MDNILVSGLSIRYHGADRKAVSGALLCLEKGKITGLVGESGSGKSTLLMSIPRLLPNGCEISGGTPFQKIPDEEMRKIRWRKIAIVPQGAMNSFTPTMTIASHIREVLKVHLNMKRRDMDEKIKSLFESAGLEYSLSNRYPHELSGGQKQRAAIAAALACAPEFLLADEPTTALDILTEREVLGTLVKIAKTRGMGMLLVTHDLPLAMGVCDKLHFMRDGEILSGTREEEYKKLLLNCSRLEKTPSQSATLTAPPGGEPKASPPRGGGAAGDGEVPPPMGEVAPKATEREPRRGREVFAFSAKNLCVNFGKNSEIKVLKNISLSLGKGGETLSIVGETGSGKTTLLRSILGLVKTNGVSLLGEELSGAAEGEKILLRRRCGYVPQDPYGSLPPTLTVLQAVTEPWLVVGKGTKSAGEARAKNLLEELKLDSSLWNSRVKYALSGGQRQRVCIARALILDPELLLCDEPTAMQDVSTRGEILSVLQQRVRAGMSMVIVTHDLHLARFVSQDFTVLRRGEVVGLTHEYTKSLIEALN